MPRMWPVTSWAPCGLSPSHSCPSATEIWFLTPTVAKACVCSQESWSVLSLLWTLTLFGGEQIRVHAVPLKEKLCHLRNFSNPPRISLHLCLCLFFSVSTCKQCVLFPCLSSLHNEGSTFQSNMASHSLIFYFPSILLFLYSFSLSSISFPLLSSFPSSSQVFISIQYLLTWVFKLPTAPLFSFSIPCFLLVILTIFNV